MCDAPSCRVSWFRFACALLPVGCLTLWSCGGDSSETLSGLQSEPAVATVAVTPSNASLLLLGDTVRLEAVAQDGSGRAIPGKVFAWSSSAATVAAVNSTGLVTAVTNGGATIEATTAGVVGSASVTVQAPTTGGLRLITTTVGRNLDPDGYTVVLDGGDIGQLGLDDTVTVGDLAPGPHSAALSGLSVTCHAFTPYPLSAPVVAGQVTDVLLGVECLGIPDDISLVFARSRQTPDSLNLVGLADGETTPVALTFHPGYDRAPDWSPDGTRLAFSRSDVIHVMSVDGTELRSFEEGTNPAWSPDGTRIAYDNGNRTFVFEPDGAAGRTFVGDGTAPAWSPDGTRIAVDDLVTQNQTDIFLMSATGQGRVNITDNAMRADREPGWSPDGSQIVFRRLNRSESTGYDLWVMDADGSDPTEILVRNEAQTGPVWLPDDRILFNSTGSILALDLDTGTVESLITGGGGVNYFEAAWRPVP